MNDLVRRLATTALSVLSLLTTGFFLFRVLPGDPVVSLTRGNAITDEQIGLLRAELGLDRPLWTQYLEFLGRTLRGDLGTSLEFRQPVLDVIAARVWPTVLLGVSATLLAVLVGIAAGSHAGWRPGGAFDHVVTGGALVLWSVPVFGLGLTVLVVLGVGVGPLPGLFPAGGMRSPSGSGSFWDVAWHLVPPCVTLAAAQVAQYLVITRSSVFTERNRPYLVVARATGLRDVDLLRRHALPNALLPVTALVFLNAGFVVSGAVVVETVFSWPGLGYLTFQALRVPDFPLLQGTFLLLAGSVILANALGDVLLAVLDPRVRER